nr:uncharacterized protein LOC108392690 [Manis javanica]
MESREAGCGTDAGASLPPPHARLRGPRPGPRQGGAEARAAHSPPRTAPPVWGSSLGSGKPCPKAAPSWLNLYSKTEILGPHLVSQGPAGQTALAQQRCLPSHQTPAHRRAGLVPGKGARCLFQRSKPLSSQQAGECQGASQWRPPGLRTAQRGAALDGQRDGRRDEHPVGCVRLPAAVSDTRFCPPAARLPGISLSRDLPGQVTSCLQSC